MANQINNTVSQQYTSPRSLTAPTGFGPKGAMFLGQKTTLPMPTAAGKTGPINNAPTQQRTGPITTKTSTSVVQPPVNTNTPSQYASNINDISKRARLISEANVPLIEAPLREGNIGDMGKRLSDAQSASLQGRLAGLGEERAGQETLLGASLPQKISYTESGYNPLTGQNISGLGAEPFSGGQKTAQFEQGKTYTDNVVAHEQAKAVGQNIKNLLATSDINPSDFVDVNNALAFVNGKVSNPKYQQLSTAISEYISSLAPILGTGGDVTDLKTRIAESMINGNASSSTVSQMVDYIDQLASQKLEAKRTAAQTQNNVQQTTSGQGGGQWDW